MFTGAYSDAEVRAMGGDARRVVVVQRSGANTQHSRQHAVSFAVYRATSLIRNSPPP